MRCSGHSVIVRFIKASGDSGRVGAIVVLRHIACDAVCVRLLIAILCLTSLLACSERHSQDVAASPQTSEAESTSATETSAGANTEGCVAEWQQVDDDVRYRTAGCSENGAFVLHVVELDPKRWSIDAVDGPRRPMSDVVSAAAAPFAINANFFDVNDRSLGVVVSSGETIRQAHPVSWQSIFSIDRDGEARITKRGAWKKTPANVVTAVQAGPRLVVNGKRNQVARAEPSLRSGVCITRDGAVRFFVTPPGSYADVHEIVELAAKSESEDGMGCHNAMLFDGGPSAQMYLDTPGKKIPIDGDNVTAFLVAKPR